MNRVYQYIILAIGILTLNACATVSQRGSYTASRSMTSYGSPLSTGIRSDVIHTVAPLETVWRISKMYDVSMQDIIRANRLRNASSLEKGQRLVIPNAAPIRPIIPLYPSYKWKYIIIHHSATEAGNALAFDNSHHRRGFTSGLGYHFVIDNGTSGKTNGQIEVSPRWIKQQNGAHCKANRMNPRSIGVCLVGNFSKTRVNSKQLDALVYLVDKLKRYYKIPIKNIVGHGHVHGAQTACPGSNFPWREFRRRLQMLD